ncbi:unnamed protein product, partial [Heterosigma akashiwo]
TGGGPWGSERGRSEQAACGAGAPAGGAGAPHRRAAPGRPGRAAPR